MTKDPSESDQADTRTARAMAESVHRRHHIGRPPELPPALIHFFRSGWHASRTKCRSGPSMSVSAACSIWTRLALLRP